MTDPEKKAYIDAELCLQSTAAKTSIEGAINRWDELDWAHITQSNIIHNTVCTMKFNVTAKSLANT